jgi:hypothetical protein
VDTARQILRYSIPGSLCIMTAIIVVSVTQVAAGYTLTAINPALKLETTAALIAASVPVGFVLYQMYYSAYGPFVRRRDGRVSYVTRDRGADVFQAPARPTQSVAGCVRRAT